MSPWLIAARPKTLTAAVVPVAVGTSLAFLLSESAHFHWALSVWALLSALSIQVGTNYLNDVIDFQKGSDGPDRLGPTRITQQGLASPRAVYAATAIAFLIALGFGLLLVINSGWPVLLIGLFSLIFAWAYTGGPYPLAYHGLGDLFVILFFGIIAVAGTALLHLEFWSLPASIAGVQVGALATVLIAINNLRDIESDTRAGKRTLAVKLGEAGAKWEISALLTAPFLLGVYWFFKGFPAAGLLPFTLVPGARRIGLDLWDTKPDASMNKLLSRAALLHLSFGLLLCAAFLFESWGLRWQSLD